MQRRRERAGHLQGPRAHVLGSAPPHRGHDHVGARAQGRAQLHLHPRRDDARVRCAAEGRRRGVRARLSRQEHPRHRPRSAAHRASRRRRVHLWRGDSAPQLARGPARSAAPQAAVPGGQGPVRQPDDRQQRRDPDERAVHHRQGRRVVQRPRHRSLGRHAHRVRLGPRRQARRVRAADGHHVQPDHQRCLRRRVEGQQGQGGHPGRRLDAPARCRRARRAVRVRRAADRRADQERDGAPRSAVRPRRRSRAQDDGGVRRHRRHGSHQ